MDCQWNRRRGAVVGGGVVCAAAERAGMVVSVVPFVSAVECVLPGDARRAAAGCPGGSSGSLVVRSSNATDVEASVALRLG